MKNKLFPYLVMFLFLGFSRAAYGFDAPFMNEDDAPKVIRVLDFPVSIDAFPAWVTGGIDLSKPMHFVSHKELLSVVTAQRSTASGKQRSFALKVHEAKVEGSQPSLLPVHSIRKWCDWDFEYKLNADNAFHKQLLMALVKSKGEGFEYFGSSKAPDEQRSIFLDLLSDVKNSKCKQSARAQLLDDMLDKEAKRTMTSKVAVTFSPDNTNARIEIDYQGAATVSLVVDGNDGITSPLTIDTVSFLRRLSKALAVEHLARAKRYQKVQSDELLKDDGSDPLQTSLKKEMLSELDLRIRAMDRNWKIYQGVVAALKQGVPYNFSSKGLAASKLNLDVFRILFSDKDEDIPTLLYDAWLASQALREPIVRYLTVLARIESLFNVDFDDFAADLFDEIALNRVPRHAVSIDGADE